MKYLLYILFILPIVFISSCNDDNDDVRNGDVGNDYLAGQWMDMDAMNVFSFSSNKTGSALLIKPNGDMNERSFVYSYSKKNGKLSIVFNDDLSPKTIMFNIKLSGTANTMMELTCISGNFPDLILWGTDVNN